MIDKISAYDRFVADTELDRMILNNVTGGQDASEEQVRKAAIEAKKLEVKLAAARLAQAEYHLDALKARVEFLEARCSLEGSTRREEAELTWARGAFPVNSSTVKRLAADLEHRKQELEALLGQSELGEPSSPASAA